MASVDTMLHVKSIQLNVEIRDDCSESALLMKSTLGLE